jgi:HEAT repeat protein
MKNVCLLIFFSGLLLNFSGCVPPEFNEKSFASSKLDFNDKNIQNIFNLLERQSTDSIVALLHDQNPQYRLCALQALASLREKSTLDSVSTLLNDRYNSVRCQAAFVLGQIGDVRAEKILLESYSAHDTTPEGFARNASILEAIGKCGSRKSLNYLCQISTFRPTDTVLITEQARAIMRFSLRDSFTTLSNKKLLAFTTPNQYTQQIRLAAAFGLSREKISFDTATTNIVSKNLLIEPSADVRIFLAKILGKSAAPQTTVETISNAFRLETNTNVKIALMNASQSVHFDAMRDMVQPLLTDKNEHLSQAAAQFFKNLPTSKALSTIREALNSNDILPATRYTLWAAIMKQYSFSPRLRDSIANVLIDLYNKETNTYDKVRILRGLQTSPYNYEFFEEQALNANNALPVRSQAAQCLSDIFLSPAFNANFKGFSISIRNRLASTMFKFISSGDAGLAAIGAVAIQSPLTGINKLGLQDNIPMMYQAIQKFKSPNDIEAIENIRDAINYIAEKK